MLFSSHNSFFCTELKISHSLNMHSCPVACMGRVLVSAQLRHIHWITRATRQHTVHCVIPASSIHCKHFLSTPTLYLLQVWHLEYRTKVRNKEKVVVLYLTDRLTRTFILKPIVHAFHIKILSRELEERHGSSNKDWRLSSSWPTAVACWSRCCCEVIYTFQIPSKGF